MAIGSKEVPFKYSESVVNSNIRGGKEKTSQTYEKLSKGLREKGRKNVAERIEDRTGGKYLEMKHDEVDADADAIIDEIGMTNAVELVGLSYIPRPVEDAILSKWVGEYDPENIKKTFGRQPNAAEIKEFSRRFNEYQKYGTEGAQAISQRRRSNANIPSMFAESIKKEFDSANAQAMGTDSGSPTTDFAKIKNVAKEVTPLS